MYWFVACMFAICTSWYVYWRYHGRRLQESGYLPPPPSFFGRQFAHKFSILAAYIGVGTDKVAGQENIPASPRRVLVCGNHTNEWDFALLIKAVQSKVLRHRPFGYRFMAAVHQLLGYRAPLAAFIGVFGVQQYQTKEEKAAALTTAVKVVASNPDSRLVIYPQGALIRDNIQRAEEYRTGAVRVLQAVVKETGDTEACILPMGYYYCDNLEHAGRLHYLALALGIKQFRNWFGYRSCHAAVAIGKPIKLSDLPVNPDNPDDPRPGTEYLRQQIIPLIAEAERLAHPPAPPTPPPTA